MSCSGIQILGSSFRCAITAATVNLRPNDKPDDIYTTVADMVIADLKANFTPEGALLHAKAFYEDKGGKAWPIVLNALKATQELELDKLTKDTVKEFWKYNEALALIEFGIKRKVVKRSVMTFAYSSKEFGFKEQIMEDTMTPLLKAALKKYRTTNNEIDFTLQSQQVRSKFGFPFKGNGSTAAALLAKLVYKNVQLAVVKAGESMVWMTECARIISREGMPITWKTPLGFPVLQDYRVDDTDVISINVDGRQNIKPNINILKTGETVRYQLSMNKDESERLINCIKAANAISANVTHSLDSSLMWTIVLKAVAEGMHSFMLVHDSFAVHIADTGRFFHLIREAFVEFFTKVDFFEILEETFRNHLPEDE